jgi:pimeloyl-ACP methyl ester carboxylesterase
LYWFCAAAVLLSAAASHAAQVTNLSVTHTTGQTFVTWNCPAGSGWTYRVYRSEVPPVGTGIESYQLLGTADDSSWCDRRLSRLRGETLPYVVPGAGTLASGRGLFVSTCAAAVADAYYAVTCESASVPVDNTLVPGLNSLVNPIPESPDRPKPVYQRDVQVCSGQYCITGHVYTLWASNQSTPFAPAMCNRMSAPFDLAISLNSGGSGLHSLMYHVHVRGGSFMSLNYGSLTPGEYVLTMDDYLDNEDVNTFWFGYQEDYNISGSNLVPTCGKVYDYTFRRVEYVLEWIRRDFPVDTTRVYAMGNSMGAIGAAFASMRRPDLIAGAMLILPLFDFSFVDDPDPNSAFRIGGQQRVTCDRLWGEVSTGLLTERNVPVFHELNGNWLVGQHAGTFVSPMIAFNGRNDTTVGWAEKTIFYATMQSENAGGCFFFDDRTHMTTLTSAWLPLQDFQYLYRFRTNLSFPAFSHCTADNNPGDGHAASGDSVGTINGFMDWDYQNVVDSPTKWSVKLSLRDLAGQFNTYLAPESLMVDVTPRRTQAFFPGSGQPVNYTVKRISNGATVASGQVFINSDGIVTVPAVSVYRTGGSELTIEYLGSTGVGRPEVLDLAIRGLPNPVRGSCVFEVAWPAGGAAQLDLYDVSGRRVRGLLSSGVKPGPVRVRLTTDGLTAGVYFLRAAQGGRQHTERVVVAR